MHLTLDTIYQHTAKRKEVEDINDEGRREILEHCQVIGLTTSGAAKYQSLIRSVAPRVSCLYHFQISSHLS